MEPGVSKQRESALCSQNRPDFASKWNLRLPNVCKLRSPQFARRRSPGFASTGRQVHTQSNSHREFTLAFQRAINPGIAVLACAIYTLRGFFAPTAFRQGRASSEVCFANKRLSISLLLSNKCSSNGKSYRGTICKVKQPRQKRKLRPGLLDEAAVKQKQHTKKTNIQSGPLSKTKQIVPKQDKPKCKISISPKQKQKAASKQTKTLSLRKTSCSNITEWSYISSKSCLALCV